MVAMIHAEAMCVRDGAREIPFVLDIASGTARLDPDGACREVRLLTWGEKCALARYADAGGAFIERQLLGTCAPGDDETQRGALIALILWLHAPKGSPLPLDSPLLARVTRALCPTLGIGLAELAALPAPEVEAIWLAEDMPPQPRQPALGADATRIVVEPDPAESGTFDSEVPATGETTPAVEGKAESGLIAGVEEKAESELNAAGSSAPEDARVRGIMEAGTGPAEKFDAETKSPADKAGRSHSGAMRDGQSRQVTPEAEAKPRGKSAHRSPLNFRLLGNQPSEAAAPAKAEMSQPAISAEAVPQRADAPLQPVRMQPLMPGVQRVSAPIRGDNVSLQPPPPPPQPPSPPLPRPVGGPERASPCRPVAPASSEQPTRDGEELDARLEGLVAFVTRPAQTPEAGSAVRREQAAEALADELADVAAALGIARVN